MTIMTFLLAALHALPVILVGATRSRIQVVAATALMAAVAAFTGEEAGIALGIAAALLGAWLVWPIDEFDGEPDWEAPMRAAVARRPWRAVLKHEVLGTGISLPVVAMMILSGFAILAIAFVAKGPSLALRAPPLAPAMPAPEPVSRAKPPVQAAPASEPAPSGGSASASSVESPAKPSQAKPAGEQRPPEGNRGHAAAAKRPSREHAPPVAMATPQPTPATTLRDAGPVSTVQVLGFERVADLSNGPAVLVTLRSGVDRAQSIRYAVDFRLPDGKVVHAVRGPIDLAARESVTFRMRVPEAATHWVEATDIYSLAPHRSGTKYQEAPRGKARDDPLEWMTRESPGS